jgi:hypothetical protein
VGASNPRARRTPPEGAFVVPSWRAAGAARVVSVSCLCFRFVSYSVFCVFSCFSEFPWLFRGLMGPDGPRCDHHRRKTHCTFH